MVDMGGGVTLRVTHVYETDPVTGAVTETRTTRNMANGMVVSRDVFQSDASGRPISSTTASYGPGSTSSSSDGANFRIQPTKAPPSAATLRNQTKNLLLGN